jgi:Tfp pilus assembly pilus retraction ATPase PilT
MRKHDRKDKIRKLISQYSISGLGRFRINLYRQRGTPAVAIRVIPGRIPSANVLQGVIAQKLVPFKNDTGRAAAVEIMVATSAVKNLIREGKTLQLYSVI